MKTLLFALAFTIAMVSLSPSQAHADALTAEDVRSFINQANIALNSPRAIDRAGFWQQAVQNDAAFINRVTIYKPGQDGYRDIWYEGQLYPNSTYRYPYMTYAPFGRTTGWQHLSKAEQIGLIQNKKDKIRGYEGNFTIAHIVVLQPQENTAIVDVDFKEYSLGYAPRGSASLTGKIPHAQSACKMYLRKTGVDLRLTRMDCNTNAALNL